MAPALVVSRKGGLMFFYYMKLEIDEAAEGEKKNIIKTEKEK